MNAKGKAIKVAKGQVIGCDLCHTLDKSFISSPTKYKGKELPAHPAPKPETFVMGKKPTTDTGGGHTGH
jgi:hypothetical protein